MIVILLNIYFQLSYSLSAWCSYPKRQPRDVSLSTFSVRWQSMWSQSRDCRNADVSELCAPGRWRTASSCSQLVSKFLTRGLLLKGFVARLKCQSSCPRGRSKLYDTHNAWKIADSLSVCRELGIIFILSTLKRLINRQKNRQCEVKRAGTTRLIWFTRPRRR